MAKITFFLRRTKYPSTFLIVSSTPVEAQFYEAIQNMAFLTNVRDNTSTRQSKAL
jgi:hypothetical protein